MEGGGNLIIGAAFYIDGGGGAAAPPNSMVDPPLFPGLLPAELPRDRNSNKRPPFPEGLVLVPQPHSPVQRGQEVLPHLPQAAPQSCCDGRLRGLAGVCACGHPQQRVLGQDSCPRS